MLVTNCLDSSAEEGKAKKLIDSAARDRKVLELNGEETEKHCRADCTIVNGAYVMNLDRQYARGQKPPV